MKYKRHIVILSPGFPASENDDTCLPAQQAFVQAFQRSRPHWQLSIIAFQYPFREASYQWKGITVYGIGGKNRGQLFRLLAWGKAWKILRRLQKEEGVDGLLSFWYGECAYLGKRFATRYGCPHFCWILGQDARPGNRYVARTGLNAGELIAMSDFLAGELERNYNIRNVRVICNGLNERETVDLLPRSIDIMGAGSLIPLKQYGLFIQCIHRLQADFPSLLAVLCGKGPESDRLLRMIRGLGLEKNIMLLDEVPHEEVLRFMQRSRIFLHPSSYEGFSTVCLEARAAGAEVVSFCQPVKRAIAGWHIVTTPQEMYDKLHRLMQQDEMTIPKIEYKMEDSAERMALLFGQ